MFYALYLSSYLTITEMKALCKAIFDNSEVNFIAENKFSMCFEAFTVFISRGNTGVEFASEDYGCKFDYCFWFEMINSCEDWPKVFMLYLDRILQNTTGTLVVEENGEKLIVFRKDGITLIDKDISESDFFFVENLTSAWQEFDLSKLVDASGE